MIRPLFSILIPAYKNQFFAEALESIVQQTYSKFQCIIVDDCSPYHLREIFDNTIGTDSRFEYYRNTKNYGALDVVDNWNKCLNYAKGDYVICMGDDDRLLPDCLNNYNTLIEKYPTLDVYHTRTDIIDEHSEIINIQDARPEWESVYSLIWHKYNGRLQYIGDFLFRTSSLVERGGFYKLPMAFSSDDISVVIAAKEKGIANMQEFGYQYRNTPYTITNSGKIEDTCKVILLAKQWYIDFLSKKAADSSDNKMRELSLEKIKFYYHNIYIYLMKKDMSCDLKKAFNKWKEKASTFGLYEYEIENEYKKRKREKLKQLIKKIIGK